MSRRNDASAPKLADLTLRQAEAGMPVGEVCRRMGVSEQSFYRWKRKYAGLGVSELRQLRDENRFVPTILTLVMA